METPFCHRDRTAGRVVIEKQSVAKGSAVAPRNAYLLGTNFSGSTVFGKALGAHPSAYYLGELDRMAGFAPTIFEQEPIPPCYHCTYRGIACPVWTPDLIEAVGASPPGALMGRLREEFGQPVLIDGSKHPSWFREVLAQGNYDTVGTIAFVTVRSPFAFCVSFREREQTPMWEAASVWRDVYFDTLRTLDRARIPYLVVRYEEFAHDPPTVLRPACELLGIDYDPQMLYFRSRPLHDVGGNAGAFAAERDSLGGVARVRVGDQVYDPDPFGGWVDEKWHLHATADGIEDVMQTPGLLDLASLLGYELGREIAGWQRKQTELAAGTLQESPPDPAPETGGVSRPGLPHRVARRFQRAVREVARR